MKVSEAKEKVCPLMSGQVATGIEDIVFATVNCICGDCMAWEYTKEKYISNEDELGESFKMHPTVDKDACVVYAGIEVEFKELDEDEKEGYCKRLSE